MWTLECEGGVLQNKRIWLRPGQKYIFGRTKFRKGRDGDEFFLDHKSVSRKHITILVSAVKKGEGSLVNSRSELTFTDEKTKHGTTIDGVKISGDTKILNGDSHEFKLGSSDPFRIKWQPVVLSFSLSTKETKGGKDPLITIRNRLEDLDIKAITSYLVEKTTHVVSSKRNTAKGLQALINAKYIVAESFIEALVYVTTPRSLDEPENLSPLEEDFDGNWPNALEYLPAKSKEPNERPSDFFKPNPERINIFEGYTFIFCDQTQYDVLQAPVLNGGGKALYFALEPGKTSADELIRYVKKVAGEKSLGEFEDGSMGKGVVLVRFRGKKVYEAWSMELGDQLALALDQRMIEQSEFMDAILSNDASMLRRPLQEEDEQDPAPLRTIPQARNDPIVEEIARPGISQAPQRRTRATVVSRFKGFDSDSDDSPMSVSLHNRESTQEQSISTLGKSQRILSSTSLIVSAMRMASQEPENRNTQAKNPRKRSAPASDEDNEEEMVDKLLPAAGAMKRRKLEEEDEARRRGISPDISIRKSQHKIEPTKPRKEKKEVNIKEVVRERREAEEKAARLNEESLRETADNINVEEVKSLAVVEEMEIRERSDRSQRNPVNGTLDSRWEEEWNGRKNFKKFRRQGESNQVRRGQSVIVPLKEVMKKDYGIGEEYWLESEKSKYKRKEKGQATQSQGQCQELFSTARSQNTEVSSELVDDPAVVDAEAPRNLTTREPNKGVMSKLQTSNNRKRTATDVVRGPSAKKQRPLAAGNSDTDSDSEDQLKFRFKKKR